MTARLLELFVLLDHQQRVLRRIEMSAPLQKELSALLLSQEKEFLGEPLPKTILPFNAGYKPDRDELQMIAPFEDQFGLHKAIKAPLTIPYFSEKSDSFENIRAVISGYVSGKESRILVQNFDRRRLITPDGFAIFRRGNTFERLKATGLTVDKRLSAMLIDDTLCFKSFHNVRTIFDLVKYFDEATDDQTAGFFGFKNAADPAAAPMMAIADSWVRKKVALIARTGPIDIQGLAAAAAKAGAFKVPLAFTGSGKNKKIQFPTTKADLKQVLRFIDEDYYESIVNPKNRYYSNSKRQV